MGDQGSSVITGEATRDTATRRASWPATRRRCRVVTAGVLLVVCALSLGACTSVRNTLGTRDSTCFRVLPEARNAVGRAPRFEGVRALSAGALLEATKRHSIAVPAAIEHALHKATCLVAFAGRFNLRSVLRAWAPRPGPYNVAIVVVIQATTKVVATALLARMPFRFRHSFAFER